VVVVDVVLVVFVAVAGVNRRPLRGLRDGQPTLPTPRASHAPSSATATATTTATTSRGGRGILVCTPTTTYAYLYATNQPSFCTSAVLAC
jgi:hypothetical protein